MNVKLGVKGVYQVERGRRGNKWVEDGDEKWKWTRLTITLLVNDELVRLRNWARLLGRPCVSLCG
jgi:hypothetical protein